MWAIANNLNDILIKQFEKALQLSRAQASLIQVAFYLAYFAFALPIGHVMKRLGLKRTMVLGLCLYALGAAVFYPAADIGAFWVFLVALFVIASGVICLEIAAGAFIVLGGAAESSAFRINLAQAFNGLGAVVAPLIGGFFILSGNERSGAQMAALSASQLRQFQHVELHRVQLPYLWIGIVAVAIALSIGLTKFPAEDQARRGVPVSYAALFRAKSFTMALVSQFFYVGAQVAVWSFFIDFVKSTRADVPERTAAYLLSGSLVLFMLGRFSGSILLRYVAAPKALRLYAALAAACVAGAVLLDGYSSIASLMLVSFFMSIMYPTNFDLGIKAAGAQSHIGAAVMVMTIVGGAIVPLALGIVADRIGMRNGYLVLIVCFLPVFIFGCTALSHGDHRELANQ
jgi:FHS family L-fucose permease-like MFS transporter